MIYFTSHKRTYILLTAFHMTAVLVFSALFILTHAKHECTGDHCPVCAEIKLCVEMIHVLREAVRTGFVVFFAYMILLKPIISYMTGPCLRPVSLVSLKIRLNN